MTTYYESAKGERITRLRAVQEIIDHGLHSEIDGFFKECGFKNFYDAGDVLRWLGY